MPKSPAPNNQLPPCVPWLFVGMPGMGKSTAANLFIDSLLAADPSAIALIHDPQGESAAAKGFAGVKFDSIAQFAASGKVAKRNVFEFAEPDDLAYLAIAIGKRRPVVLVYDEVDMITNDGGGFIDDGNKKDPRRLLLKAPKRSVFYNLLNYGRHYRVSLVGTARRVARVGTDLSSNAYGVFMLRLSGHTDLEWCKTVTDEEMRAAVAVLPKYEGILWQKLGGRYPFTVEPGALRFRR